MKSIAAGKVMRMLIRHGFVVVRQRGSHMILKHKHSGIMVPVPMHGKSKPIPIGTLHAIIKQSKIPPETFMA